MNKLLGILPYIYFAEPIKLGNITFLSVPDCQGRDHAPATDADKQYLRELSACFSTSRGLATDKGVKKALTYFLLDTKEGREAHILQEAREAVSLLRYALLRPDTQALNNVESTYIYAFALPPAGSSDYRLYQSWPNLNIEQEIWISPEHCKFPSPGWYLDIRFIHTSQLEDVEQLNQSFYGGSMPKQKDEIILAIDWYNQSFLRYSISNIARRLVDISIAFETLFQLQKNKISLKEAITKILGISGGSPIEHWAGEFYGRVRSATTHFGRPASFLYQHRDAETPHLSFLWSSQRIFRECISSNIGLPRNFDNDRLIEELIPNEVHLRKLKEAGSIHKILEDNLLGEVERLKPIYSAGKREDIIWLGKELLRYYNDQYKPNLQYLPTLQLILDSDDIGSELGLLYYRFLDEFRLIYPDSYIEELKPITLANIKQFQLESAIYNFAGFAGYALFQPP